MEGGGRVIITVTVTIIATITQKGGNPIKLEGKKKVVNLAKGDPDPDPPTRPTPAIIISLLAANWANKTTPIPLPWMVGMDGWTDGWMDERMDGSGRGYVGDAGRYRSG